MVKIINAGIKYLNDVCVLEKELFENDHYDASSLKDELINKNRIYLLALNEHERVVAYLGVNIIYDFAEIIKIGVSKEFQRQNIATELLSNMIEILKSKNINKLMLEVDEKNDKAISFYEKFGFKQISIRKNYYNNNNNALIYEYIIK